MTRIPLLVLVFLFVPSLAFAASHEKELAKHFFAQAKVADVRITPGNKGLSYISYERGVGVLKVYDFEKQFTYKLRALGNASIYDYYWVDRNNAIVHSQKLGLPYDSFVTSYQLGGNTPTLFTRVFDTLPDMKSVYLAREGRVTEKFPDLYRINAYTNSKTTFMKNPGQVLAWYTDKNGVARVQYTIVDEKDIYEYRLNADEPWRKIDINGHPLGVLFTAKEESFIIFIRRDGFNTFGVYEFDAANNQYTDTLIEHPDRDILWSYIVIDPETEESYGFHYDLDKPMAYWINEDFKSYQKTINALHPDMANTILGYGSTQDTIVYKRHNDRFPGDWRTYDLNTGEDKTVLTEAPQIDSSEMQPSEAISFTSRDGVEIHGFLTKPKSETKTAGSTKTLLMIHGGPRARDHWGWDAEAQYFAALGYAVLKVNYRGSDGYGLSYSPYSHFSSMHTSVQDTIDATHWLIEEKIATPGKISIYGSSFGGHVALSCAAEEPDLFTSAIGYAGVYNWLEELDHGFKEEPIYDRLKMRTYYGDYDNERDKWLAASAISKVDQIGCPVLLIHGRSDDVVSSTQSRRMKSALKKAGGDVKLKLLSFNRHGLAQEGNRIDFYTQLVRFLGENTDQ